MSLQLLLLGDFTFSAVHGFQEKLTCHHEKNNAFDVCAIKIVAESNEIVGNLPREISWITKFLLDCGAKISLSLTSTKYR